MKLKSKGIGWISKIQKKRHTFFISVSKVVAIGNTLEKQQQLYSYLSEENNREVIVIYLDGKPKDKKKTKTIDYNLFLEKN